MADGMTQLPTGAMLETGLARVELHDGGTPRFLDVGCQIGEGGALELPAKTLHEISGDLALDGTVVIRPVVDGSVSSEPRGTSEDITSANGAISISLEERTVRIDGEVTYFPNKQFDLLALLMRNEGEVVPRMDQYELVWGDTIERDSDRTLDVHVRRIRVRLGEYGECLQTRHRQGYMFSSSAEDEAVDVSRQVRIEDPEIGVMIIDQARRELVLNGEVVVPTKRDYEFLSYLMSNRGRIVSTAQIVDALGEEHDLLESSVKNLVIRLRARLGPFSGRLETVRYHGYRLRL